MDELVEGMNTYYATRMTYYDESDKVAADWVLPEQLAFVREQLAGRRILEIACGTGLWTDWLAATAASILATDYNESALEIARAKAIPPGNVRFQQADAYTLAGLGTFDGGFHCDFWSHVPKQRRGEFLKAFHACMEPGARVVMSDQRYWPAKRESTDAAGNHIQKRKLRDGRMFDVVKNFPSREEVLADLESWGASFEYREYDRCGSGKTGRWCVAYTRR